MRAKNGNRIDFDADSEGNVKGRKRRRRYKGMVCAGYKFGCDLTGNSKV